MASKVIRPKCCGECARFVRDPKLQGYGWCDEWGGVELRDGLVCEPNIGVKREERGEEDGDE